MQRRSASLVEAEIERLRAFAHFVLSEGPWQGGDVDGGAAQDKAEELGLIELRPCDRKDSVGGETEHYFPVWLPRSVKRPNETTKGKSNENP